MITSFEQACSVIKPERLLELRSKNDRHSRTFNKLRIIAEAINGEEPNWNNEDEMLFVPMFNIVNGVFSYKDVAAIVTYTDTNPDDVIVFDTAEAAEYAGKTFLHLFKELTGVEADEYR